MSDVAVERGDDGYWKRWRSFLAVVYDVVDDSLIAICQARLCPQVCCQPKDGVLADDSFHREASSLIGRLTFGRCIVAFGYSGGNRLPVCLHLTAFVLNSGESRTGDSCLKSPDRITDRFPNGLSL